MTCIICLFYTVRSSLGLIWLPQFSTWNCRTKKIGFIDKACKRKAYKTENGDRIHGLSWLIRGHQYSITSNEGNKRLQWEDPVFSGLELLYCFVFPMQFNDSYIEFGKFTRVYFNNIYVNLFVSAYLIFNIWCWTFFSFYQCYLMI